MSLTAHIGRTAKKALKPSVSTAIVRNASDVANGYNRVELPEVEAANIAPFIVTRKPNHMDLTRECTSVGVRDTTVAYKKFESEPVYNLYKELSGFNEWAEAKVIGNPEKGVIENMYTKTYIRDPETGEAVMPNRFKDRITHEELQKVLQKADHYFFSDRPNPILQMYVPIEDPRIVAPRSPLAKAVDAVDRMTQKLDGVRNTASFKNDEEMFNYLEGQFDKIYENGTMKDDIIERPEPASAGTLSQYSLTAQQRRAEFWRKYLELFNYYDVLHACTVRCTRATGREGQNCALVILGNCHGIFTYGRGKASNHELAVRRALLRTRRNVLFTPLHEHRTPYYPIKGTWKKTQILLLPQKRGVGLRAGRLTFNLLRCVGYKDASLKMFGRRNLWNLVRAWMECLKYQESYREVAFARGAHYQHFMDPFIKNPPAPSRDEIQDLEDAAAKAFGDAVKTVFDNRQLLQTDTFKELRPHFELREGFEERWKKHLEAKNVPEALHMYPTFSQYLDCAAALDGITRRAAHDAKFQNNYLAEIHDPEDADYLINGPEYVSESEEVSESEQAVFNAEDSSDAETASNQ